MFSEIKLRIRKDGNLPGIGKVVFTMLSVINLFEHNITHGKLAN